MDFVLALHSHLPYVLNHGRWPHGSDWLCEAALDTYLPLLEELEQLAKERTPAPVTIGFTPVLANQLASPQFVREMEEFFTQRLTACNEVPASVGPLVDYWRSRFKRLQTLFRTIDGDLVSAFRRLEERGLLEIIGSAATHGYLPLLARKESIRLQLAVGQAEHKRLFGVAPRGCWVPECAYKPGVEQFLSDAGFSYFFTDSHLAHAGSPLRYGDMAESQEKPTKSPYQAYRVTRNTKRAVAAFVRDPRSSMQIWSRHQGYPGDAAYLEFHKIRWPGGLKLWRVTGPNVDLGAKLPYEPRVAADRATNHASHFAHLLETLPEGKPKPRDGVIVAPFDTELYGHWWFEGPDFLAATYRALRGRSVKALTASQHLAAHPPRTALQLAEGSWGANGDHSMWLNDRTAWTWKRLHPLEHAFWKVAPAALKQPAARPILAQAARELLLAQSSDWQFIISTGAVVDYGEKRFNVHCDDAERLVQALEKGEAALEGATRLAEELARRDDLFPNVLAQVKEALDA